MVWKNCRPEPAGTRGMRWLHQAVTNGRIRGLAVALFVHLPGRREPVSLGVAMLTLAAGGYDHNCQGFCRRDFLRIGGLGLFGGLTLPSLLRARSEAPSSGNLVKD